MTRYQSITIQRLSTTINHQSPHNSYPSITIQRLSTTIQWLSINHQSPYNSYQPITIQRLSTTIQWISINHQSPHNSYQPITIQWLSINHLSMAINQSTTHLKKRLTEMVTLTLLIHSTHFLMDFPVIPSRNEVSRCSRSQSALTYKLETATLPK